MKNFTYPLIFLVSLCLFFTSKAQEKSLDYIITLNNDTLRGEIFELNNTTINFRSQGEKIKKTFNANQLKSYFTFEINNNVKKLHFNGSETNVFVKELLTGYVYLYELSHPNDSLQFYLELPQKNIVFLPHNNSAWAVLRTNLLECSSRYFETLMAQSNYQYSEVYFKQIVKNYNLCVKPHEQVHEPRNTLKSSYGILLGIGVTNWNYTFDLGTNPFYNFNGQLSNELQTNFGLFYILNIRKKLSLELDLMYNQYSGYRDVPVSSFATSSESYKLSITEKYINMPILLTYDIVSKFGFKLIGKAGPTIGYDFTFDETKSRKDFASDLVVRRLNTMFLGYGLGIGIEKKISPKMNLNIDLRFSNHGIQDEVTHVGTSNSFQLRVGLGFHK